MSLKAGAFLHTFKDYPSSQIPASFTLDQVEKDIDRQIENLTTKVTPTDRRFSMRGIFCRETQGHRC
jgi:hypothetical protein